MLFYELFNSWDNFWLCYLSNLSVISEQPELIPDLLVSVPNFSRMVAILVHHRVPILDNGGTGLMDLGSVTESRPSLVGGYWSL